MQNRLKQNHIQFFSDLSGEEKSLFIDEVERSLFGDDTYRAFQGKLSRTLDETLSDDVDRELMESGDAPMSKVDRILEKAAEGA